MFSVYLLTLWYMYLFLFLKEKIILLKFKKTDLKIIIHTTLYSFLKPLSNYTIFNITREH